MMRQKLKKPDAPWMRNRKVELQKEAITSLKELTAEESLAAVEDPPRLEVSDDADVPTITPSARASDPQRFIHPSDRNKSKSPTPSKKPASINRPGRRPDYSHGLIGLEPGDTITFAKNQKVQGRILDHTYGVEIAGQIFNGIVPSAQYAYKISNIVPPKRVTGLAEWIVDKTGNKISFEYKLVPPIP